MQERLKTGPMLLMNFFRKLGARCPCAFAALSLAQLLRCRNGEQRLRTATYEDKGQTPAPSVGLPHKPFPMLLPHSDVNAPCGDDVAGSVRDPHLASCHPLFPSPCLLSSFLGAVKPGEWAVPPAAQQGHPQTAVHENRGGDGPSASSSTRKPGGVIRLTQMPLAAFLHAGFCQRNSATELPVALRGGPETPNLGRQVGNVHTKQNFPHPYGPHAGWSIRSRQLRSQ